MGRGSLDKLIMDAHHHRRLLRLRRIEGILRDFLHDRVWREVCHGIRMGGSTDHERRPRTVTSAQSLPISRRELRVVEVPPEPGVVPGPDGHGHRLVSMNDVVPAVDGEARVEVRGRERGKGDRGVDGVQRARLDELVHAAVRHVHVREPAAGRRACWHGRGPCRRRAGRGRRDGRDRDINLHDGRNGRPHLASAARRTIDGWDATHGRAAALVA